MPDEFEDTFEEVAPVEEPQEEPVEAEPKEASEVEEPGAEIVEPETETMVPLKALLDERDKRQTAVMEAQAAPRPEPEPIPDVIDDPQGYAERIRRDSQQEMSEFKLGLSRQMAEAEYGEQKVRDAYAYFNDHPAESQALMASASPFHEAVKAHERAAAVAEIGDPVKYKADLKAEILAELKADQPAPEAKPAPSLANETSIGGRTPPAAPDHTPLGDII